MILLGDNIPDEWISFIVLSHYLPLPLMDWLIDEEDRYKDQSSLTVETLNVGEGLASRFGGVHCLGCQALLGKCLGGGIRYCCPDCKIKTIDNERMHSYSWAGCYNRASLISYVLDAILNGRSSLKEIEDYQYVSSR